MDGVWMIHNSHNPVYRQPFGAVPTGEWIQLTIHLRREIQPESLSLRLWEEGGDVRRLTMTPSGETPGFRRFLVTFPAPDQPGLLWYDFEVIYQGKLFNYGNHPDGFGGEGEITTSPVPFQITVYKKDMTLPKWFREGIMYQIFVDRFFNGTENGQVLQPKKESFLHACWDNTPYYVRETHTNRVVRWDFFGGNLLGIIKKLPYLKDLGVSILYLNPIFEAISNHKYDTGNYHRIDPMFGDEETFSELCETAEKLGISLVLDGVFSHTGDDSVYFNRYGNYPTLGAYQSKDSPYYSWYRFENFPNEYDCWWGIDSLPNTNEMESSYLDFIIQGENSVLNHWMDKGVKGWRLDVADELPDEFIRTFRQQMRKKDLESILIGEVWEDASNKISYGVRRRYFQGEELDSVTNYPFRERVFDFLMGHASAAQTHLRLMNLYENYPLPAFYGTMNVLGSHDVPRLLTYMGREEGYINKEEKMVEDPAVKRTKLAVLWQMTFPGVPCVYYGDEAGLTGGLDPLNRKTYPWGKENQDLLTWYHKMIAVRKQYPVFATGNWYSLFQGEDVYGYIREIKDSKDVFFETKENAFVLVLINRNSTEVRNITLNLFSWLGEESVTFVDLITGEVFLWKHDGNTLDIGPLSGKILIKVVK